MEPKISRRTFISSALLTATVLAGCGGGGNQSNVPNPNDFHSGINGSVLENTELIFDVGTRWDPDFNDFKVVAISLGGQVILQGENLVFEINGQRYQSGSDSATRSQVQVGDRLSWKEAI